MATATATPKTKAPAKVEAQETTLPVRMIDLRKITANTAQSRGMGALSNLQLMGWGLFEKIEADKEPIWLMLVSDDAEVRNQAKALIEEYEPTIIETATSLQQHGQLQPIGVIDEKGDGSDFDVMFGMQRAIARAYNWVCDPNKYPRTVEAKIHPAGTAKNPLEMKLRSRTENRVRKEESPIDRAMFYKELMKEHKLTEAQIAEREDVDTQTIKNYLSLLHPLLKDKQVAIHNGELKVDPAIKLLARRKEGKSSTEKDSADARKRSRFPSVKTISLAYSSGIKPKKMDDDLWEFYKHPVVREFLAKSLGLKYAPYKEPSKKAQAAAAKAETNGTAAKAETNGTGKKPAKTFTIPRSIADKLLIALGQTNARTWNDQTVADKLENVSSLGEDGMTLEDKGAQELFDKLMAANKDGGYAVKIKAPAKK